MFSFIALLKSVWIFERLEEMAGFQGFDNVMTAAANGVNYIFLV